MKIDTTKIDGYDNMSAEEKLAALEGFEYDDGSAEITRYKNAASKANKEAAEWKRKHNSLLTEDEKNKQEKDDELERLKTENASLIKARDISANKAKYVALGYDEKLAEDTATALVDGDMEKVLANQQTFLTAHDKAYKAELMGNTPTPPAGESSRGIDYGKKAEEAAAAGNFSNAAYYTRLAQEQEK
jgi:hypothetical protein